MYLCVSGEPVGLERRETGCHGKSGFWSAAVAAVMGVTDVLDCDDRPSSDGCTGLDSKVSAVSTRSTEVRRQDDLAPVVVQPREHVEHQGACSYRVEAKKSID
jgi:hypothetical protein